MSRASNELRNVFFKLYKNGQKPKEIADIIGVTRQTVTNWIRKLKVSDEKTLLVIKQNRNPPRFDLELFEKTCIERPFLLNRELGAIFGFNATTAGKYRKRLNFSRKKARTVYKESDPELKKNSRKIYQHIWTK